MLKESYSPTPEKRFLARASAPIQNREDGGKRILSGYGAVFYDGTSATEYDLWGDGSMIERVMPGSFDRAMKEDDCRSFFNHDPNQILGRTSAGTSRLSVDARGLIYEIDIPNTCAGNDTWESVNRGDVSGASIMFQAVSRWIEDGDKWYREVTEFKPLYECGPVVFPAYTATTAQARDAMAGVPDEIRAELAEIRAKRRRAAAARERTARVAGIISLIGG